MNWLVTREELTVDQLRAVNFDITDHRLIVGGPGSGKTQILIHRAAELIKSYNLCANDIKIFAYTNSLCHYIKTAAPFLEIPIECISTFDHWCLEYLKTNLKQPVPYVVQDGKNYKRPDHDKIRNLVRQQLSSTFLKQYKVILIDEVQDLGNDALNIINKISDHVTVFADSKQQIYEQGLPLPEIKNILKISKSNIAMLETFRASPYIVELAANLIEEETEKRNYLKQVRTDQIEKQKPLYYLASDAKDEQRFLAEKIRSRLNLGDSVAVLFPQRRLAHGWANAIEEMGLNVENPDKLDLTTPLPKFMVIHSAKGLTFDSIFIPKLANKDYAHFSLERKRNLLFVGITRARKWVCLSSTSGVFDPLQMILNKPVVPLTTQKYQDISNQINRFDKDVKQINENDSYSDFL